MLLALWPAILSPGQWIISGHAGQTAAQRAIHGKEVAKRKNAISEDKAKRLQEFDNGNVIAGDSGIILDSASISAGNQLTRTSTDGISRHKRTLLQAIPAAFAGSMAENNAISFQRLDEAMKQFTAKQAADEDDDMAMIMILGMMQ